jgi:hypothetical protein
MLQKQSAGPRWPVSLKPRQGFEMKHVVTVTASGPCGSGKSAVLGEIEIAMRALGVPVRYLDDADAQSEKNMTHADWANGLDLYKPEVVLVEKISGTPNDWDRWYRTLPDDLKRKMSLHDFKRLGECFRHALGAIA